MQTNSKYLKPEIELPLSSAMQKFDKGPKDLGENKLSQMAQFIISPDPKVTVHIEMKSGEILSSRLTLGKEFSCIGADARLLDWLENYSRGIASPLHLQSGTPFQREVMEAMGKIPFGQTVSYKELAELCGNPRGARAIGNACGRNPFVLFVPCHRVIHSDGKITGFSSGPEIKKRLLDFEASMSACPG